MKNFLPKNMRNFQIKKEVDEIKKRKEKIKRKDLKWKQKIHIGFSTVWNNKILCTSKTNKNEAEMDQSNLLENWVEFNNKYRPKNKEGNEKKKYVW